jgi:hypothetical protein
MKHVAHDGVGPERESWLCAKLPVGSRERLPKEAAVQTQSHHAGRIKHSTDRILLSTQDTVYRVAVLHELKELCSGTTIDQRSTNRELERTVCTDIYHRTSRFHR